MNEANSPTNEVRGMDTNNGTGGNGRIEFLKQKEREIRARIAAELVRQQKRKEKEDARLRSIIGAALVQNAANHEDYDLMLKGVLKTSTFLNDSEMKLLRQKGWL